MRSGLTLLSIRATGIIPGRVIRIDPAALNGTVGVDVALLGPLPQGARAELSVDGTIEIERLPDVVYVDRPVIRRAGHHDRPIQNRSRRQRRFAGRM